MPRPRSLRLQYSLRALVIFITLFMIWGGYHANRGWKQRAAEAVLRRHEARISYLGRDHRYLGNRLADTYGALVHALWGETHIHGVDVRSNLEAEVVEALIALPQMDGLGIMPRAYSSSDMSQLVRGQKLEGRMNLPEGAMQRILARRDLKGLSLVACSLDSDDCEAIVGCENIESLYLLNCGLSEEGFAELLKLPRLRWLSISHCQVTGSELKSVAGSMSLDRIDCIGTPVGEEFAAFVKRCSNVTSLQLGVAKTDSIESLPHE
jgi:hypothetical protein